jgi:hypothetical protein
MIAVPQMVMIGGNSRNSGKTTMACSIIGKLAAIQEVIGLKVTNVRKGEDDFHGIHEEEITSGFTIFKEINPESNKDTSKMLLAGATQVYYIRASETFVEQAVLHFLSEYINKELIVCESRSLRGIISPGLFLMMMRVPVEGKEKEITEYLKKADKVFYLGEDLAISKPFMSDLSYVNDQFVWS